MIMTEMILFLAIISSVSAQQCYIFGCGQLNKGQCIGAVNFGEPTINVNSCPAGQFCNYASAPFSTPLIGSSYCQNIPAPPAPQPTLNIPAGDFCNTTLGDTCNKGNCVDGVCVSNNKIGSACSVDIDCPTGSFCNKGTVCTPFTPPGGNCVPGATPFSKVSSCGYSGRCINNTCVLPYSLKGNTGVPLNTSGGQLIASYFCESGYADGSKSNTGYFMCVHPPHNDASHIQNGVPTGSICKITQYYADGTFSHLSMTPICGYNQNSNLYCPWEFGDAPLQKMLNTIKRANVAERLNVNCNPASQNCAYIKELPYDVNLALGQFIWARSNIRLTPFIANNAECVQQTLTSAYWGSEAKTLGLTLLATALILFA